jgi:hypothetical protein
MLYDTKQRFQNFMNVQRISVLPKSPIPEFLDHPQKSLHDTKQRLFQNFWKFTESLHDATQRFQNFWNDRKMLYDTKQRFQNFRNVQRISVLPKTPIPEFLDHPQNHCMTQNSDYSRTSGTSTESLYDPTAKWYDTKQRFQNFWNVHKNLCMTQNTKQGFQYLWRFTEYLYDTQQRFQNFWNFLRISV